ncbi:MAG: helicase C-terminal domain-containing protein [Candidatus Krumholzibacteriota bacterium]
MTGDRDLLLMRQWARPGRRVWLAVDLLTGDRIHELKAPDVPPVETPGAILVSEAADDCRDLTGGGLLIPEGWLWSLLDPLAAAPVVENPGDDRFQVESSLREVARRFRLRLEWYRGLDPLLRESCRGLLRGYNPDLEPFLDVLDDAVVAAAGWDTIDPTIDPVREPVPTIPLKPDPETVYAWLGAPDGLGSLYGAEFAPRQEQAQMGRDISRALTERQPLLIEAGTGVGKTLAYLVPLVALTNSEGSRAVVSTHTRALQTQIMEQDLPRLKSLLGDSTFTLLMGRRNYLCLRQRQSFLSRPVEDLGDALKAVAFRLWLEATTDGMRDELAAHPLLAAELGPLFDGADLCLPGQCYEGNRCFVQNARRRARTADILVVNHSLLLADRQSGHTLLGEVDHLVVDEAHRLPAVTLDAHTVACGTWRMREVDDLVGSLRGESSLPERVAVAAGRLTGYGPEGEKAAASCEDFGGAIRRVARSFEKWWRALGDLVDEAAAPGSRDNNRVRVRDKDEAFGSVRPQTSALLEELADAAGAFAWLAARTAVLDDLSGGLEDDLAQLAQAGQLLNRLHQDVHFLMTDPDESWVTWVEPARNRGVRRLGATLLESGEVLRDFWLDADYRPIMTSATLAVGEDFSHMLQELGLTRRRPGAATSTTPSPFDYHKQVLILAPSLFPDPGASHFGRAVGEVLRELALGVPRKTMGLFTSYRLIRESAEILQQAGLAEDAAAAGTDRPVLLAQNPRSGTGALLHNFRRHARAVLLGTTTFWEGVDFPGEDLEILVVTKLPFLVPSDPWVEARCERVAAAGENPFTSFMVRDAVLRLRQGFGRLIRRTGDRGVVIILDNRLHTKNYGATFLGALPVLPVPFGDTADLLDRVEEFFRK